jgi:pyridoxal phosphate enzyme (YggS family)
MTLSARLDELKRRLPDGVRLLAVSKFQDATAIREAYDAGQRLFGESRVQELLPKHEALPSDIEWHFIGHLQANKARLIAPFISMIQSVDSLKLLDELDRQAGNCHRRIRVLLQIHIAQEEHKFGFSPSEAEALAASRLPQRFPHLIFSGLMGMATFTEDKEVILEEFATLAAFFARLKALYFADCPDFRERSIGMSDDYPLAIAQGSTMIRLGTAIFGARKPLNSL